MDAVRLLIRAGLRTRRGSLLALVLLVALVSGVVLAGAAGARRTATVLDRFRAETATSDVEVIALAPDLAGDPQRGLDLAERLGEVDGVESVATSVGFPVGVEADDYFMVYSSPDGSTYAELDREDPVRATVMNGSFLRASLFTSVVSFGIAAMAMGLGIVFILIGVALRALRSPNIA